MQRFGEMLVVLAMASAVSGQLQLHKAALAHGVGYRRRILWIRDRVACTIAQEKRHLLKTLSG